MSMPKPIINKNTNSKKLKIAILSIAKWLAIAIAGGIVYDIVRTSFASVFANIGNGLFKAVKDAMIISSANINSTLAIGLTWSFIFATLFYGIQIKITETINALIRSIKNENEDGQNQPKVKIVHSRKVKIISYTLQILIPIMVVISLICVIIIPITYRASFESGLERIAPYVSEQEINMYKSKWVQMRTQEDFEEIRDSINTVCDKNGLIYTF